MICFRYILLGIALVYGAYANQISSSGIEKYLKPVLDKTSIHKIRNIDFIYMINLDERPKKFEKSCFQLHPYGIYPYRFSAVNGWKLPFDTIDNVGVKYEKGMLDIPLANHYKAGATEAPMGKLDGILLQERMKEVGRTYFAFGVSFGSIGIVLSHLSILQDAYDAGYETIWVMEDDVHVIQDPNILSMRIDELDQQVGKSNWDVLFTDRDTKGHDGKYVPCSGYAKRPNFSPADTKKFSKRENLKGGVFRKIGARFGAYSMILRRSGVKKILEFIKDKHIFLPYDIDFTLPNDIIFYTVIDDIVSTLPNAYTDNSAPYYEISPDYAPGGVLK